MNKFYTIKFSDSSDIYYIVEKLKNKIVYLTEERFEQIVNDNSLWKRHFQFINEKKEKYIINNIDIFSISLKSSIIKKTLNNKENHIKCKKDIKNYNISPIIFYIGNREED